MLLLYVVCDLLLALHISIANFLVIVTYLRTRHIQTPTNAYIFSLSVSDFLTGAIGIPATVAAVVSGKPSDFRHCLAVHLILCILCTVSTFNLLAIALDKFITICCKGCRFFTIGQQQLSSRHARARWLIALSWVIGAGVASMPLADAFGFASSTREKFNGECQFVSVVSNALMTLTYSIYRVQLPIQVDYRYMVHIIFFGTIIFPSLIIAFCYAAVYVTIRAEENQIKCLLRGAERQRRVRSRRKLVRVLLILVLTYALCWYPLYWMNTIDFYLGGPVFPQAVTFAFVVLSHINSLLNPMIYAYGMPGFKQSLRKLFLLPILSAISSRNRRPNGGKSANEALRHTATPMHPSITDSICEVRPSLALLDASKPAPISTTSAANFAQLSPLSNVQQVERALSKHPSDVSDGEEKLETRRGFTPPARRKSSSRWRFIPALRASLSSISKHENTTLGEQPSTRKSSRKYAHMLLAHYRPPSGICRCINSSQPPSSSTFDSELSAAIAAARERSCKKGKGAAVDNKQFSPLISELK